MGTHFHIVCFRPLRQMLFTKVEAFRSRKTYQSYLTGEGKANKVVESEGEKM